MTEEFFVCPTCRGTGKIVNPAVDGHGLTAEDFDEMGPESEANYFEGVYDIVCPECSGLRVVTHEMEIDYAEREQDRQTMLHESGIWGEM